MKIALFLNGGIGVEMLFYLLHYRYEIVFIILKSGDQEGYDFLRSKIPSHLDIFLYNQKLVLQQLEKRKVELVVVACFNLLPRCVWEFPRYGTINLHYSLLPSYKGPTPLEWILENKEKKFGFSIHKIAPGVDSGPILFQQEFDTPENATVESLARFLIPKGCEGMKNVINILAKTGEFPSPVESSYEHSYYSFYSKSRV